MSSRIFSLPENLEWKQAYMAAVLEKDRGRLPPLIQDATQKLSERLHELWGKGPVPSEEVEASTMPCTCFKRYSAVCRTAIKLASEPAGSLG